MITSRAPKVLTAFLYGPEVQTLCDNLRRLPGINQDSEISSDNKEARVHVLKIEDKAHHIVWELMGVTPGSLRHSWKDGLRKKLEEADFTLMCPTYVKRTNTLPDTLEMFQAFKTELNNPAIKATPITARLHLLKVDTGKVIKTELMRAPRKGEKLDADGFLFLQHLYQIHINSLPQHTMGMFSAKAEVKESEPVVSTPKLKFA